MADGDFYTRDRPPDAGLPEDRPRGSGGGPPGARLPHSRLWRAGMIALAVVVVIAFGIMLFP
ncbi:hypothetical protein [Streptomyces qinzhouensis]|uniref:Uncharacterized protein n=1 Tax=Streptomyces qinzhouensis TaxID=2599401 RepID=A0A5B8JEL5_9ACTN|nr:hypothetical protein [Streptomyces qinzhouensis]QDY80205.1 hypothetical protein FQU76_31000 [Streptomyces qinzhouensis]